MTELIVIDLSISVLSENSRLNETADCNG